MFLSLLFLYAGHSQNVIIRGKADSSYAGRIIQLYTLTDEITGIEQKEGQDTIESDGYFAFGLQEEFTQPAFLRIDNVVAQLYIQPDFVYGITIPAIDPVFDRNNDADLVVNIGIIGTDSTELNALIFDYEDQYNLMFASGENHFLSKPVMFGLADSLQRICAARYATINNDYFRNYVTYSIASVNASVSRGENFLIRGYLLGKPIQYRHHEYMKFFNTCFSGYLKSISATRKGQSLYNVINVQGSYSQLNAYLKEDKFLKQDSIRELVAMKNLWDFYFSPDFSQDAVKSIITQLNQQTKIKEHRRITSNMLSYFNKMQPGSMAPGFTARTKDGTVGTLNSYKGHWVYLNFFSSKNLESLREMPKIAALKKKFGDKMSFISICVDDSLKSYKNYLRDNPKFDWAIWYNDASFARTPKDSYFVTGSEAYFLINNTGYLVQSPAPPPSKGIENKFTQLFKPARRNTKTGIR